MRLKPAPPPNAPLADWPRPYLPPFIETAELGQLKRELTHYLNGEIPGRSFLIAGHRGTGKTSLVRRAVDDLADDLLDRSTKDDALAAEGAGRKLPDGPFQRPLLVKLHGPTMLQNDVEVPKPAAAGTSGDATTKVEAGPHAALLQITVALYRALVGEISTGFTAHARRHAGARGQLGCVEMAAQLALELDRGADPALLRQAWCAIGRLEGGVLWPASADETLQAHRMDDQGLRELAAVVTAGKAYLKCTGKLTEGQKRSSSVSLANEAGIKASADNARMVGLLSSVGLGVAAGAAVQGVGHNAPASFGAGLLTWLLGTLSLDWSARRTSKADSSTAQSFDADVSLPTLERDLPQIITRMRRAGLAPVFAIDELDKLEKPEAGTASLINQFKHIVTDLGFFCFLVDRDYFEQIEQRLRLDPYGMEHTFFSDRILVRPDPTGVIAYLIERLDAQGSDPDTNATAVAIATLGLMYDSRLNLTTLMRGLARLETFEDAATIANSQRRRVLATIQIAANLALRESDVQARAAIDPTFAQLAIDAAYYVAFMLESGKHTIDASEDALRDYLNAHLAAQQSGPAAGDRTRNEAAKAEPTDPETAVNAAKAGQARADPPSVTDRELKLLHAMLRTMLAYLEDFDGLRAKLGEAVLHDGLRVKLATLLPDKPNLCARENDTFRFAVDQFGGDIADSSYLDANDLETALAQVSYFTELTRVLDRVAINLDELAQTPFLNTLTSATLASAAAAIDTADRTRLRSSGFNDARAVLDRAFGEISRNAASIGWLVVVVGNLFRVTEGKQLLRSRDMLLRIAPLMAYDRPPQEWLYNASPPSPSAYALPTDQDQLDAWASNVETCALDDRANVGEMLGWNALYLPIRNYFRQRGRSWPAIGFADLVAAVLGQAPQCHLNTKLASMRIRDWSALACACMPPDSGPMPDAPYWLLVASLRALGFGSAALARLVDPAQESLLKSESWRLEPTAGADDQHGAAVSGLASAVALIDGAPDRPAGLLIDDDAPDISASIPSTTRGILVAPADFWQNRSRALNRLIDFGLFDD
jgi:hypothetical protein